MGNANDHQVIETKDKYLKEIEELKKQKNECLENFHDLQSINSKMKEKIETLKNEIVERKRESENDRLQNQNLTKSNEILRTNAKLDSDQNSSLKNQNDGLERKNMELSGQIKMLNFEKVELEQNNHTLQLNNGSLEKVIHDLERNNSQFQKDLENEKLANLQFKLAISSDVRANTDTSHTVKEIFSKVTDNAILELFEVCTSNLDEQQQRVFLGRLNEVCFQDWAIHFPDIQCSPQLSESERSQLSNTLKQNIRKELSEYEINWESDSIVGPFEVLCSDLVSLQICMETLIPRVKFLHPKLNSAFNPEQQSTLNSTRHGRIVVTHLQQPGLVGFFGDVFEKAVVNTIYLETT